MTNESRFGDEVAGRYSGPKDRHEHFDHDDDLDHCPKCGSTEIYLLDDALSEECEQCGYRE